MAEIAASLAHVTAGIQENRRQRHELAVGIKAEVKRRHGDVHSLLTSMRTARGRAGAEYRRQALTTLGQRRSAVKKLLTQLQRERQKNTTAQREKAATFMRDLSSGVAAFLDRLDTEGADRAAYIHGKLKAYALDRHQAEVAWIGEPHVKAVHAGASKPNAAPTPVTHTAPGSSVAAAHSSGHAAPRTGGQTQGRGTNERHGGDSK